MFHISGTATVNFIMRTNKNNYFILLLSLFLSSGKWEIPVFYLEDKYLCKNRIDIGLLEVKIKDWSHKS